MTELLTAAQMRAIEEAAITSGAVTGLELMERAGAGVVEAVLEEWPELAEGPHRAVVLCGPGNNGGDGFVVARMLKARGWEVEVYLYGDREKLPPDAMTNYERWSVMGDVLPLSNNHSLFDETNTARADVALYVDALLGTGLTRHFDALPTVQDELNQIAEKFKGLREHGRVVAVDIPSGLSSDTGHYPGYIHADPVEDCIIANLTVTFHRKKIGHVKADGPVACGKLVIKDIGL